MPVTKPVTKSKTKAVAKKAVAKRKPIDLVINTKKWACGDRNGKGNMLLGSSSDAKPGKMCCLGFLALACGYDKEDISGQSTRPITSWGKPGTRFLVNKYGDNSAALDDLVAANDNINSPTTRKAAITELFAKHNVKVKFV